MATNSRYTHLWINEYEFSGETTSIQCSTVADTIDTTAFQDGDREYIIAVPQMTITHNGHLTVHDTDSVEAELSTYIASGTATVAIGLGTNVAGYPCKVLPGAIANSFEISAPVDGLLTIDGAEWVSSEGHQSGLNLYDGTVSATGAETAVDFASAGSAGGKFYLIVTAITGTATSATIDVESATTSGGTYASEGTATFSAVGAYEVDMSGTVNRYIRINCTSLGGATSFVVVAIACVTGVTTPS